MKYLLAAEADKIQSMIFRSVKLAEVVRGSQLLTSWCADMAEAMLTDGIPEENILVADGGAFRVVFDDSDKAIIWAERLAESYSRLFGSTISVTEPLPFSEASFKKAASRAQKELRRIKNRPQAMAQDLHNPYVAHCQRCGIGLANREACCTVCLQKKRHDRDSFTDSFVDAVQSGANMIWR